MKGVVLCAGLGTRLRPLTDVWPKPAMPLLGAPILRYAGATLRMAGVTELGINTHHLPQVMEDVARREWPSVVLVREADGIQGTGGGIRGLREFLKGDDFVVLNGDVVFAVDLRPIVAEHRARNAAATMVLLPMPKNEQYNTIDVDSEMKVRRIAGKGPGGDALSPWHFTGAHVMSPRVFDFMAQSGEEDIRDVYARMLNEGETIAGHVVRDPHCHWSDLGTPQRYASTHEQLLLGQVSAEVWGADSPFHNMKLLGRNIWAHPTARIHADVKISGPAYFAAGCSVAAGVRVGALVSVGCGAHVGEGARLNRVAVLDGATVEAGAARSDALIAPGVSVALADITGGTAPART